MLPYIAYMDPMGYNTIKKNIVLLELLDVPQIQRCPGWPNVATVR